MNIRLIVNPASGRGLARRVADAAVNALRNAGHTVAVSMPGAGLGQTSGDAPADIVVIAGGDGTVHHALNDLVRIGAPVFQLPIGTENLFARHFGMTTDPAALLHAIRRGMTTQMDLGRANGRLFSLMCSVGFDADVVHGVCRARKGSITRWIYLRQALWALRGPLDSVLTVRADGQTLVDHRPGLAVVANCAEYGGRLNPAPGARDSDGLFDIVFYPIEDPSTLLDWLVASKRGRHVNRHGLIMARAASVEIESVAGPRPYQVDGEASTGGPMETAGPEVRTPLRIELLPHALRVLLPEN